MLLSIVIPVYNEAACIPMLIARLRAVLGSMDCEHELVFVNDGSTDETGRMLSVLAAADRRIRIVGFTRNFGHQAAITAGLDFASGDAAVIMDADLQDPPELLPEMLRLYSQGYDVVSAQRQSRSGDGLWKKSTAAAFYWVMRRFIDERLQAEVGDFRLFSRAAVVALRRFREQHRFMRGIVAWLGLREIIIPFQREARADGVTKYSTAKMFQLAWTAISSFSALPLRLSAGLGFGVILFGIGYFCWSMFQKTVPGWTSLVCLQIIFSGAILMAVGILGNYVGRIYEETKRRPLYVVSDGSLVASEWREPERSVVLEARPITETAGGSRLAARVGRR